MADNLIVPRARFEYAAARLAQRILWRVARKNLKVRALYDAPQEGEKLATIYRRACLPAAHIKLAKRIWRRHWTIENYPTPPGFW